MAVELAAERLTMKQDFGRLQGLGGDGGVLVGEEAGEGRGGRSHRLHVKAKSNKGSAGSQIVAYV